MNETLTYLARHPWAVAWHPHEGLWNSYLSVVFRRRIRRPLIWADTAVRCASAGLKKGGAPATDKTARIVFLDIGLHRLARQSVRMMEWFGNDWDMLVLGYEAHPEFAREAEAHLRAAAKGRPRVTVEVANLALVGPNHTGDSIDLHLDGKTGKGNSLFAEKGDASIRVPTARLSDHIRSRGVDPSRDIVVVRMNIEGAELFVVQDLVAAGLVGQIGGYYGMWNDLFKISPRRDAEFRAICRENGVKPFPFNDRDLGQPDRDDPLFRRREWAIRTHLAKSIRQRNGALSSG